MMVFLPFFSYFTEIRFLFYFYFFYLLKLPPPYIFPTIKWPWLIIPREWSAVNILGFRKWSLYKIYVYVRSKTIFMLLSKCSDPIILSIWPCCQRVCPLNFFFPFLSGLICDLWTKQCRPLILPAWFGGPAKGPVYRLTALWLLQSTWWTTACTELWRSPASGPSAPSITTSPTW